LLSNWKCRRCFVQDCRLRVSYGDMYSLANFSFSLTKISPCFLVFPTLWSLVFYHFFALNSDCKICIVPCLPKTSPGRPSVQSHNYLVLRILGPKGNIQWLPLWISFQNHGKLVWSQLGTGHYLWKGGGGEFFLS
jgi:hypothetical protein